MYLKIKYNQLAEIIDNNEDNIEINFAQFRWKRGVLVLSLDWVRLA